MICKPQNTSSCTKRQSSNTGAAVLAPLGAFGSAAPVSQSGVPRRVGSSLGLLQTPDPQTDPALSADRPHRYLQKRILLTLRRQNLNFRLTFCRSKIHQKSDSSKIRPKSQKADPESQNADFGWISGAILASIFDQIFDISHKTPKSRFYCKTNDF